MCQENVSKMSIYWEQRKHQGITTIMRDHPLGIMNVWTKPQTSPSQTSNTPVTWLLRISIITNIRQIVKWTVAIHKLKHFSAWAIFNLNYIPITLMAPRFLRWMWVEGQRRTDTESCLTQGCGGCWVWSCGLLQPPTSSWSQCNASSHTG